MKMSVWSLSCQQTSCFSAITVKNIYESFTHNVAAKASWHWNYATVTICISLGCCLKAIRWQAIAGKCTALETRTTTCGPAHAQSRSKVPGGTTDVTVPTWTVPTWEATTLRTLTASAGAPGPVSATLCDSLRWRSDRSTRESFDSWIPWHFVGQQCYILNSYF